MRLISVADDDDGGLNSTMILIGPNPCRSFIPGCGICNGKSVSLETVQSIPTTVLLLSINTISLHVPLYGPHNILPIRSRRPTTRNPNFSCILDGIENVSLFRKRNVKVRKEHNINTSRSNTKIYL